MSANAQAPCSSRSDVDIFLTEVIVVLSIGWAATLYGWRRKWLKQQQAWQWWHQQQAKQAHSEAESIRDGLLQQTFAFRLYLEGAHSLNCDRRESQSKHNHQHLESQASAEQTDRWLEKFQTFYQALETLSDKLSPPFVADSLPHALQFAFKNWPPAQPATQRMNSVASQLQFNFPPSWPESPPHQNQAILSVVTALLALLFPAEGITHPTTVKLSHQDSLNTLTIVINNYPDLLALQASKREDVEHLKEIFHSLTAGQLDIRTEASSITGRLCWQHHAEFFDSP